jgi:catabolite regulation protein CreA
MSILNEKVLPKNTKLDEIGRDGIVIDIVSDDGIQVESLDEDKLQYGDIMGRRLISTLICFEFIH